MRLFRRKDTTRSRKDSGRSGRDAAAGHVEEQPGADVSSPVDTEGTGRPVGLADRTRPGGQGSPDTNQGKTESMPPTAAHRDPDAAPGPDTTVGPDLGAMSIGKAPSQLPSAPALAPTPAVLASGAPEAAAVQGTGGGDGAARRAPLSQGVSPEEQETDVQAGAEQMARSQTSQVADPLSGTATRPAGDTHGVPSVGDTAASGTSEQLQPVQGVRAALAPEDEPA